jgi:glycosyltransferase involved in cell wall biosynthesis
VSFIVTTYNMPHQLLRECLESIGALGLNDDECEIVLVDDGSEVTPLAELSDWQDRMVYLRQQNCGLSVARNNGLRIATGRYIQFVDGDDCLLSNTYCQCLEWVKEHDADMMLFGLNTQSARDSEDDIAIEGPMTGASYLHNHNLRASACGYLFQRLMLDNLRFTPGIYHEDEEFTPLLLLKADQLYFTEADAYYYRQREESITHQADEAHTRKRLEDMRNIIYRLQKTSATIPEGERVALSRRVAQLSMDYLYQTIRLTRNKESLDAAIKHLEVAGLFPLPDKAYTKKYSMFRRLVGNAAGRRLLLLFAARG